MTSTITRPKPIVSTIPSTIETTYKFTFEMKKVPSVVMLHHPTPIKYMGNGYTISVLRHKGMLSVYLTSAIPTTSHTVNFILRMAGRWKSTLFGPVNMDFQTTGTSYGWHMMAIEDLKKYYCDNGKFTVDLVFVTSPRPPPRATPPPLIGALADVSFTDFSVVHGDMHVACHQFVVARESKVIRRALSDTSSSVYRLKTLIIKTIGANEVNTRLFVQCMYEGWLRPTMDKHAIDLLMIADSFQCNHLIHLAIDSLTYQLTDARFWETCDVAVVLKETCPSLLETVAKYASSNEKKVFKLFRQRPAITSQETATVLMDKLAKLSINSE